MERSYLLFLLILRPAKRKWLIRSLNVARLIAYWVSLVLLLNSSANYNQKSTAHERWAVGIELTLNTHAALRWAAKWHFAFDVRRDRISAPKKPPKTFVAAV
jgi:hypothetical protein